MQVGLIADIHADIRALETALRHLERLEISTILCAGDLVGYGDQPDAVVAVLRERSIPCIRGNHDRWAVERRQVIGPRGWKPATFNDDTWEFLETLPGAAQCEIGGRPTAIYHGSPGSDTEFVSPYKPLPPSVERFWAEKPATPLVLAHTHIPMIERTPAGMIVNPGSILGVPGVQTSYTFGVIDGSDLAVRIYEVRTGRVIRRDPISLVDE